MKSREQGTNLDQMGKTIEEQNKIQRNLISKLESLDSQPKLLIEGDAKIIDRIVLNSFNFLKKYLDGMLINQETLLKELLMEMRKKPNAKAFPGLILKFKRFPNMSHLIR
jgi:hypothetical protein